MTGMARTSKPNCLGVIPNPLRNGGKSFVAYGVSLAFPLLEPGVLLAEVDAWQAIAPYLPSITSPDTGAPKAQGEWLLAGSSHSPQGMPLAQWLAEVQIGVSRKQLRIHGPRQWQGDHAGPAEKIQRMDMAWEHTYGGADSAENRRGCGMRQKDGSVVVPSIELADHPWRHPDEACCPAGTLPVDVMHPRRQAYAGTYGADYLERYFPGMPADFDRRYFNVAPADQQIAGMWQGNEPYALRHWHPELANVEGQLPGLRVALHIARKDAALERVDMALSTVWFFPEVLLGMLIFHGMVPSTALDGSDIERVIAGVERLDAPPMPVPHYEAMWQRRTDRCTQAAAAALDDSLLCPPGFVTRFATVDQALASHLANPALARMGTCMSRQWLDAAEQLQNTRDWMREQAMTANANNDLAPAASDPHAVFDILQETFEHMAEISERSLVFEPSNKAHELLAAGEQFGKAVAADLKAVEGKLQQALAGPDRRQRMEELMRHWEQSMAKGELPSMGVSPQQWMDLAQGAAMPRLHDTSELKAAALQFEAQILRDGMTRLEAMIRSNDFHESSEADKRRQQRAFERMRKFMDERGDETADGAERMAEEMRARVAMMQQLLPLPSLPDSRTDPDHWQEQTECLIAEAKLPGFTELTEADLVVPDPMCRSDVQLTGRTVANWQLHGVDMRGSALENMTFIACDLRASDWTDSRWRNCTLIGCDLTGAQVQDAHFDGLSVKWSCLDDLQARGSTWVGGTFLGGRAQRADWQKARWEACTVIETDLADGLWKGGQLTRTTFSSAKFGQSSFSRCQATQSAWNDCDLRDCDWTSSVLTRSSLPHSRLPRSWPGAYLTHVSLRAAELTEANWQGAHLNGVDLSLAKLRNCDFSYLKAHNLQAQQADLRDCNFSNATIDHGLFIGADLRQTNFASARLHHCWLGLAHTNAQTNLRAADVLSSNFHPQRDSEPRS
jgi:uncharacterized protein YjbI with pentapeptide repeats